MTKYIVEFYELNSDSILATPSYDRSEYIEADSIDEVNDYVTNECTDGYGHKYIMKVNNHGYTHISAAGAAKVSKYTLNLPTFVKLKR